MYYDLDFLVYVNYVDDIAALSQLVCDALPDAEQILVSSLAYSNNQIFIEKNTLYDANDESGDYLSFRWIIQFIHMGERPPKEDEVKKQAEIAAALANAFAHAGIQYSFGDFDVTTFWY